MKKLLLTCMLAFGLGASAQILTSTGFEPTATPTGFAYTSFSRTAVSPRFCTGAAALTRNFWNSGKTGSVVYSSTTSNGTALDVSFSYKALEYGGGSGVGGDFIAEYSIDGGTTYTQIGSTITLSAPSATCTTFTGSVAAGAIPVNANFKFRISGLQTSGDFYFILDDVALSQVVTCPGPTNPTISGSTTSGATLNWTAASSAPANGYEIYYSSSNVAPTASTPATVTNITGTTTNLTSLTPATNYYAYVRSNCSSTEKSAWTNTVSFTTACIPITTLPWSENFDAMTTLGANILPPCWISQGTQAYTSANAASNTYNDPRSNPNYVTVYYPAGTSYLWSPGFTLTAGQSYDFTFYWVGDGYSGWEGDVLVNSSQSETGATQVGSSFISGATTTASTYTKSKSIFIPTTTGTYYFAVKSFASSFDPYYMGFDDFSLEISSTCSEPTALSSSNLTTTSADVSWTAPAIVPAFGYEVYYNTTNVAPTAATVATISNITTTNTTLTPLNSSSTYYFWVRSVCSATEKSSWSNVGTFNTACATVNIPYTQDFSSAIVPALPNCTSAVNNGTGNIWETSNSGINGNSLRYGYSFTDPADTWFFTPGMSMTAGNTYYIGYKYAGTSYDESMKVAIGTTPDAASMTTVINDYPSITGNAVNNVVDQMFTPTVSGVYYLGFQAYSAADQNALYVDDITVTATPLSTREISVKENLLTVAPNPFKDIIRISDVKDVVSISIVDLSGRLVKTVKPAREINLGDLKTGMYLINLKMKDGSVQTVKAIKK